MAAKRSYNQPLNVSCIVSASIKPKIRDSIFYMMTRNSIVSTNDCKYITSWTKTVLAEGE